MVWILSLFEILPSYRIKSHMPGGRGLVSSIYVEALYCNAKFVLRESLLILYEKSLIKDITVSQI